MTSNEILKTDVGKKVIEELDNVTLYSTNIVEDLKGTDKVLNFLRKVVPDSHKLTVEELHFLINKMV